MKRILFSAILAMSFGLPSSAQRAMDKLDRGLVAVPGRSGGNHVSWRKLGEEYYDTQYNLYRDGTKIAGPISLSNYEDKSGNGSSTYQVEAIVNGVTRDRSAAVQAWSQQYLSIAIKPALNREGTDVTAGYSLNDISLADVNGDGVAELFLKRRNDSGNLLNTSNKTDFNRYEVYDLKGNRLWWIDLGPNMMSGPDEQWDMIGYDWDGDGKAEAMLRGADNMIIHTADGKEIHIGDMTYDNGGTAGKRAEYTHEGKEYLLYLNGETGVPYGYDGHSGTFTPMEYPLPRYESGESDYATVWGKADTGHRSDKHYFGAPYLDGTKASIFLGRGCYTRHKMCALDVDPVTHVLTQRWRWNTYDSHSPWFGNGFHNFQIADVDLDGRDEIVFGSMVIDDNGKGLVTTGLGHGDAQHCGDLDPYRWGLEQFNCLEGSQGCSYWNATTGELYYRKADGGDDGRALAGNFTNDYPGGEGRTVSSGIIGLTSDKVLPVSAETKMKWDDLNCRIYWDGDLLDEIFDSPGVERSASINKWGNKRILTSIGQLNNSSKNNPCALGDIMGDWREEFIIRNGASELLLYTTNYPTVNDIYTLWDDHEYRNAMAWQCMGYNQPPHPSFFLGEAEGITVAPPPVTLAGRTVVPNGATLQTTTAHLLLADQGNMTVSVADGASPWIVTDNAPCIVQGSGADNETGKTPQPTLTAYTHTLTGGAFSGKTRLVKQGEGTLVLPNVVENYTGPTDVWNGTLRFDGTLAKSRLWLNRHTTLVSDGGKFAAGVRADYNATIYPGGQNHAGSISVSRLDLGFGSRVVFDLGGTQTDELKADTLTLEASSWGEYGPKYHSPVFQFNVTGDLTDGKYLIATVDSVAGNLSDIVLEGIGGKRCSLSDEDGKVYLHIETMRDKAAVVWNGTDEAHEWDPGVSENFMADGRKIYSATGDDVTFNDDAANTQVVVKGAVSPGSILFSNEHKDYTLSGDSIVGGAPLTKEGVGMLTITNSNLVGNTVVNGGKLVVNALANLSGIRFGALGTAAQTVTVNNGATLAVGRTIITDQPFIIGSRATLEMPAGTTLTVNRGLVGAGAVVTKKGEGALTIGAGSTIGRLVIDGGTVNDVEANNLAQLPDTVEFVNGTLYDTATDGSYSTNAANFVVPEGSKGTLHGDPRCNYTGTLTGAGTFTVYDAWVRCTFAGDWSQFEGTLIPMLENRSAKKIFDNSTFDLTNSFGMPKATLQVGEGINVNNNGKNFAIGSVAGTGTLSGAGTWTVGTSNKDFSFDLTTDSRLVKKGTGRMTLTAADKVRGQLQIDEGSLGFSATGSVPVVGASLIVNAQGAVYGQGQLKDLTLNDTAHFAAVNPDDATLGGEVMTMGDVKMSPAATATFAISGKTSTGITHSQLSCGGDLSLGHVVVTLAPGYVPEAGDSICLWTAAHVMQQPTAVTLPALPRGLVWDSTSLTDGSTTAYLRIVVSDGVRSLAAGDDDLVTVYTLGGQCLGTVRVEGRPVEEMIRRQGYGRGTYIIRGASATRKVVVK
jgi:autotransporter-associated beta strand protein